MIPSDYGAKTLDVKTFLVRIKESEVLEAEFTEAEVPVKKQLPQRIKPKIQPGQIIHIVA